MGRKYLKCRTMWIKGSRRIMQFMVPYLEYLFPSSSSAALLLQFGMTYFLLGSCSLHFYPLYSALLKNQWPLCAIDKMTCSWKKSNTFWHLTCQSLNIWTKSFNKWRRRGSFERRNSYSIFKSWPRLNALSNLTLTLASSLFYTDDHDFEIVILTVRSVILWIEYQR